jgi:signal peptidase II
VPSDGGDGGGFADRRCRSPSLRGRPNDAEEPFVRDQPGDRSASARGISNALLAIGIVAGVWLLDQLTKVWAVASLSDGPVSIVGDTIELELSRNPGGAFSLFQSITPLLAVLAVGVAFVLVRAIVRAGDRLMVVALALVLGGALGNLSDRVARSPGFMRGEVVDFVSLGTFPTFNVADSAITIGAVLLVVCAWRQPNPRTG